jgi:hypothetical protein
MFTAAGDIEVAGTASPPHGGEWRAFAARLLQDGALEPSSGTGGTVVSSLPPSDEGPACCPVTPSKLAFLKAMTPSS